MNFDHFQAIHAARDLGLRLTATDVSSIDVSVHPPFTDLRSVQTVVEAEAIPVSLGAQNCAIADSGAFTGEVSALMLAKMHIQYVIVGHSERRQLFCETDEIVVAKLAAVFRNGMTPICCVGETGDEREAGQAHERLANQVAAVVASVTTEQLSGMVIAYEPIWAIGTGQAATPDDAQEASAWIRSKIREDAGDEAASQVRIQYGGSVTPDNAASLLACPDVDGALVGGASLDAAAFVDIIRGAGSRGR